MKIERVFVEFDGDPAQDQIVRERYCSIETFKPIDFDAEIIEFVSKEKYDRDVKDLRDEVASLEASIEHQGEFDGES